MTQPTLNTLPTPDDPYELAGLQREFASFLEELEQVGRQIAWRSAEEKAKQPAEASGR